MELKVKIDTESEKDNKEFSQWMHEGLRKQILKGAVEYIVKELTPDRLEKWAMAQLDEVFQRVSFYDVQKEIEKYRLPIVQKTVARPEIQEKIRIATEEAINQVIAELPQTVKKSMLDRVEKALKKVDNY